MKKDTQDIINSTSLQLNCRCWNHISEFNLEYKILENIHNEKRPGYGYLKITNIADDINVFDCNHQYCDYMCHYHNNVGHKCMKYKKTLQTINKSEIIDEELNKYILVCKRCDKCLEEFKLNENK